MAAAAPARSGFRRGEGIPRWILSAAIGWAAIARAAYLFFYRSDPLSSHLLHDARRYHEWAAAWAEGRPYESGPFYQAPVYPAFLSLLYRVAGPEPFVAYAVQTFLGCSILLLAYRVAARIAGPRAGAAAAVLGSLYGTTLFYETKLLPATIVCLLAILLVERLQAADRSSSPRPFAIAGAVAGLASLASGSMLLGVPIFAGWILLERARRPWERIRRAGWFVAGAIGALLPAVVHNYHASGELILVSTNGGVTFYQGNHPEARGIFALPEGFSGSIFKQREESRALAERETGRPLSEAEVSSFFFRKGLRFAIEEPAAWLALEARKFALALASTEVPLEYHPALDSNPARWLAPLPFGALLALACTRLLSGRPLARAEVPAVALLGIVFATLLGFYVTSRYRLPAVPALLVLAGSGVSEWWEAARRDRRRAAAGILVACAVLSASTAYAPLFAQDVLEPAKARGLADLGEAAFRAGKKEEALAFYRRAVAVSPSDAYARLDLSKLLRAAGDLREAERQLREAARIAPALSEIHFDLGVLLYETGRLSEAGIEFAEAYRLDRTSVPAANNLLGTLLALGRRDEALAVYTEMKARGLPVDPPLEAALAGPRKPRRQTP